MHTREVFFRIPSMLAFVMVRVLSVMIISLSSERTDWCVVEKEGGAHGSQHGVAVT